jgi:hypothetical protein
LKPKVILVEWHSTPEYQIEFKKAKLLQFLDKNSDVFAWSTSNLVGVSREVIEHKLQVNPRVKPKKQKLRRMSEEKVEAAKAEVQ